MTLHLTSAKGNAVCLRAGREPDGRRDERKGLEWDSAEEAAIGVLVRASVSFEKGGGYL